MGGKKYGHEQKGIKMVKLQRKTMKTKILYLDHAPYEGGAEVSLKELVKNLDKKLFEAVVVCPKNAPYAKELADARIRIIDFHYHWTAYKFIFPLLYDVIRLIGIIRRESPQIIHTNTRVTNQLGGLINICCQAVRLSGCQAVFNHVRDRDPLPFWKLKLIGNADLLIANSKKTKEFLVTGGVSQDKIRLIYNGVDINKFDSERFNCVVSKEKLGISENQKVITAIGQIYPRKGISFFIKALKIPELNEGILQGKLSKVKFFIVGEDPTPNQHNLTLLKSLVSEMNLENVVDFLGYRIDIPEILAATDIFVLPSLEEPFGRVLIEAMAMKLPVIATNVGGIPEIIEEGKNGFLVPAQNPTALAEKLLILLKDDKMRQEFGLTGRRIVEEKFTLEKHVEQIENIYKSKVSTFRHSGVPPQAE